MIPGPNHRKLQTGGAETLARFVRGAERRGGGAWDGVSPPQVRRWRGSRSDSRHHPVGLTACGETQAAQFSRWGLARRPIPAEPLRFAPPPGELAFCVAFRSQYTRYSSLTRLVSRAPLRARRSPGFHHRLLARISHTRERSPSRRRHHADAEYGAWRPCHQAERRAGKGTPTSGRHRPAKRGERRNAD